MDDEAVAISSVNFDIPEMTDSFHSIYYASSYFWIDGYGSNHHNGKRFNESDYDVEAVIIADAIGGAMWAPIGPAAFFISAAYSIGVHHRL